MILNFLAGNFDQYASPWIGPGGGFLAGLGAVAILIAVFWSLYWKGVALWQTARRGEKVWFVVFLIVNTLGILEILYLYVFSKKSGPVRS